MSRGSQLAKNTLILTIGKISTQFISFFLLPLYTALLTTEEYGTVDLLNTYISLLVPIITFQIAQGVFRFLIEVRKDEESKSIIITSSILFQVIQSIIFLVIFAVIARWFQNDYKYFLATNVVACIFSSLMLQIARGFGDNKAYAVGSFITATMTVVLNVIFIVWLKMGAYGMLIASLIANILCTIYLFFKTKTYKYLKIDKVKKEKIKELCKYSVPLIPNAISWWIVNSSDKTIITAFLGTGMNGIYSVSHKFSSVYITVFNIYNTAWTESTAMHIKDEDSSEYISSMMTIAFKLFSCMCIGIIACMPFVFNIMVNESYSERICTNTNTNAC